VHEHSKQGETKQFKRTFLRLSLNIEGATE
jgi:hypothetical protein